MVGNKTVPNGWFDYTNLGRQLAGTPFVPFKVPLKQAIRLPGDRRFTPEDLMEQLPELKLIINLTNARNGRYYRYADFESKGITVVQIKCEGRGILPPAHKLKRFYDAVEDFLRGAGGSQPEEVIGVHCTHGLNRTGYFICKYLIEKMNMAPDVAIELFETARGHHIVRQQYTNNLRNIEDDDRDVGVSSEDRERHDASPPTSNGDVSRYSKESSSRNVEVVSWRDRPSRDDSNTIGVHHQPWAFQVPPQPPAYPENIYDRREYLESRYPSKEPNQESGYPREEHTYRTPRNYGEYRRQRDNGRHYDDRRGRRNSMERRERIDRRDRRDY